MLKESSSEGCYVNVTKSAYMIERNNLCSIYKK